MSQELPPSYPPPYYQDDEITLKELILKLRSFGVELFRSKWLLLLFALLGVGGFVAKALLSETSYKAGMSFMVNGNDQNQARVMSPFGPLDFGNVENNKITELARSGRIIHKVLLTKKVINDDYDYIANHLIKLYNLHEEWVEEPTGEEYDPIRLEGFYFSRDSIADFSQKEYRALNILSELLAGNNLTASKGLMKIDYNEDNDIFRLDVNCLDDEVALSVIRTIFDELQSFYTGETVGRTQEMYDLVSVQTDSLNIELERVERAIALSSDRNRAVYSSLPSLNAVKLQRDLVDVRQEFLESSKSKKTLELLLNQQTPDFQIIDQTFIPVEDKESVVKGSLIGLFLGLFLGSIWVIGRKIIRDAMAE